MNNIQNCTNATLIMMVGIVGSGKSFKAKVLSNEYNAIIHSSDEIRKELCGDINSQEQNEMVFKVLHSRIFSDLHAGKNVVYDATNISIKSRKAFLNQLENKKIVCNTVCFVMATPYEDCLANNTNRERKVPEEVIKRMYKNFEMPSKFEGFDDVQIVYNRDMYYDFNMAKALTDLIEVPHDNPHHSLSVGMHCFECQKQMRIMMCRMNNDLTLERGVSLDMASLLHDVGKAFTKEFKDSNGDATETAHYYQHHCVGAYDSMFYLKGCGLTNEMVIRIILLINHHMKPFDWKHNESKKSIRRFKGIYGEEFYEDINLLHECDVNAH